MKILHQKDEDYFMILEQMTNFYCCYFSFYIFVFPLFRPGNKRDKRDTDCLFTEEYKQSVC